ncbi:uncharacterized protein BDR25DRAFT_365918 [Lindgomyces ingoldianus]|uniref:Uncharacterized protein n=1 Tax=Lindgomyces ingoldianus TaxID=673940 RepID=A0ACB6R0E0_9PLEO|nr:uncharacterized protein BDR25DRAFT_365918 [Lindgomyces ingoldianus]KAF2472764.1 hypothetical protein BDR25DRAFT_365918 [Lindgomyces ingoldianus]
MDSSGAEPGHRNAPSSRGGIVLVSLYSWTCVTIGVAAARFIIGRLHRVKFGFDDATVVAGSTIYIGATVCWHLAVNNGLGKHSYETESITDYFKFSYTAQLLQIAVMGLAKLSSGFLVGRVVPQTRQKNIVLFGTVGFWALFSLPAFAFQCSFPAPWVYDNSRCSHGGLLYTVIALNIISDLVLSAWIFPVLHGLQMNTVRRGTLAVLFGSRALVPVASIAQIWAAAKAMKSQDPTWDGFELAIMYQIVTSLSLIVASLPRIKRFLSSAGTGISNARVHDGELATSIPLKFRGGSQSGGETLKLTPSNSGKFTATVVSGKSNKKEKGRAHQEWHKFVSMGSTQDEHTSTSSLFENPRGVMLQQEVTVQVENSDRGEV